jgi:hypothetical protein
MVVAMMRPISPRFAMPAQNFNPRYNRYLLARKAGSSIIMAEIGPGIKLGNYEITGIIGRGGMGKVYSAYQPSLKREVAIKVVQPDSQDFEATKSKNTGQLTAGLGGKATILLAQKIMTALPTPISRALASVGTRPMPTASGEGCACPPKPSGSGQPVAPTASSTRGETNSLMI